MPVRASHIHTDAEFDSETVDYASLESLAQTGGGAGIGVAVVDSGIEPGTDFDNRIAAFYDFTHGDIRAVTPIGPVRPWHARRGVDRERVRRRRAERAADWSARAQRERAGRHGERRARHRVRDCEQGPPWHRRAESLARPSDLRAGGDRPARAGGRARDARGHRRGGFGRQLRH